MATYLRIVDRDKQLASEVDSKTCSVILRMIKDGTFWAYRGDTKKRPNARSIKMKYINGELT